MTLTSVLVAHDGREVVSLEFSGDLVKDWSLLAALSQTAVVC